ncbi:uncharacterized protein PHALS_00451 [Plasmopara halstedii]|uniref:Uncharacterized protein n=1 Tax=Plasmopara halstedii TaxID=4781 RepID=A0A0P1A7G6_PLAHL|nr:uncharacterized protein PHALS_00451 [Plasmopara halstedii]CEG36133.1 hypothetical protein PHALS_00451 [Plasmopara halstedii]|eukprot:XP_024572502.1 hypothetical protein PHALS_00451 [Plasmopara halstedii]
MGTLLNGTNSPHTKALHFRKKLLTGQFVDAKKKTADLSASRFHCLRAQNGYAVQSGYQFIRVKCI